MTARLPVSRQLPTALDSVISGEDALLLQYLYGSDLYAISPFARRFACEYDPSITPRALRHALLAAASYYLQGLDGSSFGATLEKHVSETRRLLICALEKPDELTEAEIFAGNLLSLCDDENSLAHCQGSMSMLISAERFRSDRPLFRMTRTWILPVDAPVHAVAKDSAQHTLVECIELWTQLDYTSISRDRGLSGLASGMDYWLCNRLLPDVSLWYEAIVVQQLWGPSPTDETLNILNELVKGRVANAEFHPVWRIAEDAFMRYDDQISDWQQVVLACSFVTFTYVKRLLRISDTAIILSAVIGGDLQVMPSALMRRYLGWKWAPVSVSLIGPTLSGKDPNDGDWL
jgi:hypothetical protein